MVGSSLRVVLSSQESLMCEKCEHCRGAGSGLFPFLRSCSLRSRHGLRVFALVPDVGPTTAGVARRQALRGGVCPDCRGSLPLLVAVCCFRSSIEMLPGRVRLRTGCR